MKILQILSTGATALTLFSCGTIDSEQSTMSAAYPKAVAQQVGLWQVTATGGLNCRTDAGTQFPSVYGAMNIGTLLDGMSSKPGVFDSKLDNHGRLWMHVVPRSNVEHTPCYVLAEDRYVKPFITEVGPLSKIEGDLSCQVEIPRSETYAYLETNNNRIYLCSYGPKLIYLSYDKGSSRGTPSLKLVADLSDAIDSATLDTATEARFQNGAYTYSVSFPRSSSYPVANLSVTQSGVEFPIILDTPALAFYR